MARFEGWKLVVSIMFALTLTASPLNGAATVTPLYASGNLDDAFAYRQLGDSWGFPVGGSTCSGMDCGVEMLFPAVGEGSTLSAFLAHASMGSVPFGAPPYTDTRFPQFPYPALDFSAGDAPLSSSLRTTYDTVVNGTGTDLARWGPAIYAPVMGVPIALAYNPSGLVVGGAGQPALRLSRQSMCGIMTGGIKDWSDPSITADNGGDVVSGGGMLPINVVVRSDVSGETFILSEALNTQCSNTAYPFGFGGVGLGGGLYAPIWPQTFDQIARADNVQAEILAKTGSIGYLNFAFVLPFSSSGPPAATLQNGSANFMPATLANAKSALTGPFSAVAPCGTVNGTTTCFEGESGLNRYMYNPDPSNANAYPLVGFSFGYFYTCSTNSTVTSAISGSGESFFRAFLLLNQKGGVLTLADRILENNGFAELPNVIKSNSARMIQTVRTGPVSGTCTL